MAIISLDIGPLICYIHNIKRKGFIMRVVSTHKVTGLDYSASRWQLFDDMNGVASAAQALNNSFMEAVNSGKSREQVGTAMDKTMDKYSKFGAFDTEPRGVLEDLLDEVFGEE